MTWEKFLALKDVSKTKFEGCAGGGKEAGVRVTEKQQAAMQGRQQVSTEVEKLLDRKSIASLVIRGDELEDKDDEDDNDDVDAKA